MTVVHRRTSKIVVAAFAVAIAASLGALTITGQLPIPVPGQQGPQGQGGQTGRGAGAQGGRGGQRGAQAAPAESVKQVAAPIPTAIEVSGPGAFFETFMDNHDDDKNTQIPAKDTYAKFNYEAKEY